MMEKRAMIIKLSLDAEEEALFVGRWALIVPLSPEEAGRLGTDIMVTHVALWGLAASIGTTIEQIEDLPQGAEIVKGLAAWRDLAEGLHDRMERVKQVIGRGKSVGPGDGDVVAKGKMQ